MTNVRTLIALSTAVALGISGAASVAHASPKHKSASEARQNPHPRNSSDGGRGAFGYQPAGPTAQPLNSFERNWFDYQDCRGTC